MSNISSASEETYRVTKTSKGEKEPALQHLIDICKQTLNDFK